VEAGTLVALGHIGKPVRRLEAELLVDLHHPEVTEPGAR
jgi:hypothetical protein